MIKKAIFIAFLPLYLLAANEDIRKQDLDKFRKYILNELEFSYSKIESYIEDNENYLKDDYYWFMIGKREALFQFSHWVDCIYFPYSDPPLFYWPEH